MISTRHAVTHGTAQARWLSNVVDLASVQVGDNWLLFAANMKGGISSYRFSDPDAPLQQVHLRALPANLTYQAWPQLTVLDMSDGIRLLIEGLAGAGVPGLSVGTAGQLGDFDQLFPAERLGALSASGELITPAGRFLFSARHDSLTVEVNRIAGDGSLARVSSATLPMPEGVTEASLDKIIAVVVEGQRLLVSMSGLGNFIATHRIGADGRLAGGTVHHAAQGAGYDTPSDIAALQFGGRSFLIVAAEASSSLSVLRLDAAGRLRTTDHVLDELPTRFQSVTALATAVVDERGFVMAGGADGGISIFTLLPDGRLVHLQTILDTDQTTLGKVNAIEAQVIDGKIVLFVTSSGETGVTQLVVDPGAIGTTRIVGAGTVAGTAGDDLLMASAGTKVLQGGAGDDILVSGPGNVTLTGGAGADIFAITRHDGRVVVSDYEPGTDRLDLSMLGMIRSSWQLDFAPQPWGMRILFGESVIEIHSLSGKGLRPLDFGNEMFPIGHYWLPERDPVDTEPPISTVGRWVFGTDASERLLGGGGGDSIAGRSGNDTVLAGWGNDTVTGDGGHDTIRGDGGADRLLGGNGNDLLFGDAGADLLQGQAGNDLLYGGGDRDALRGGSGNDRLYGGTGADRLYGDGGNDTLSGEDDGDYLEDLYGSNVLIGGGGNDRLVAGSGDDTLSGGSGNDRLQGGAGRDRLGGHSGNDILRGGSGNDLLDDRYGSNRLYGDQGNDTLISGSGADSLRGGSGADVMRAGEGRDRLYGEGHADRLFGEGGDDLLNGGAGDDGLQGSAGRDTLDGATGNDTLRGQDGNDVLTDGFGNNRLYGDAGNDVLRTGRGADLLFGGSGNDRLHGGPGRDRLDGGSGNDRLYGGGADDVLRDLRGNNGLDGGAGNDRLIAGAGRDWLKGGAGNDVLSAGAGNDRLWGQSGQDVISAGAGRDVVSGGSGSDRIYGEAGNDRLRGDQGNDTLRGGAGADLLTGGAGADVFLFRSAAESGAGGIDVIEDFEAGRDHLDLRALKLRFIGDEPFGAARQLRVQHLHDDTLLLADLDGDGRADFRLRLDGLIDLDRGDFLL